jgi:hypothetical protein
MEGIAFAGFWMGGFEGADHVNGSGVALDMAAASGHVGQLEADHARAAAAGLRCVRESIGWRLAEPAPGSYDFERALRIESSARRQGLQVLWTLMHYGLPDDLSLHDDSLIERFARFAGAAARVLGREDARPPVFTLVNEIGFLSWAASMAHVLAPPNNLPAHAGGAEVETSRVSGYQVKCRLVRATLAGMKAIRAERPAARFLHVEPLVHVVEPAGQPELAARAAEIGGWQWQAWDLLAGRAQPHLGGHHGALDLLGVNHYHGSQWEIGTQRPLRWHEQDPRWRPFSELLQEAWGRYRRPLVVAETGHVGEGRAAWLHDIASQSRAAMAAGVPLQGLCLYPLVDRPDWDEPQRWHRSGLWHADSATGLRTVEPAYAAALGTWQRAWAAQKPTLLALIGGRHDTWPTRGWHLLSRLAGRWRVVVLELPRPAHGDGQPRLDRVCAGPLFDVLVPRGAAGPLLQDLLQAWWCAQGLALPLLWLADEAAVPLLDGLPRRALVCDLGEGLRDARAVAAADLVLGQQNAPARSALPDGVDDSFFSGGGRPGWDSDEATRLQAAAAQPRLGCAVPAGARLDTDVIVHVASARPQWEFVFCGPAGGGMVLPALPNVHGLAPVPYRLLPRLMGGWRAAWHPSPGGPHVGMPGRAECAALGLPWASAAVTAAGWLRACDGAMQAGRGVPVPDPRNDWSRRAGVLHGCLAALLGPPAAQDGVNAALRAPPARLGGIATPFSTRPRAK